MPQWHGKSRGTPLGYRLIILTCKYLGVRTAYFVLRFVALYFFFFSPSSSGHIYHYFRERHGFSKLKSRINVYRSYYVFAQTLLDKVVVMAEMSNRFSFVFEGESNLHDMAAGGKGGILLSAHAGNWEAAGHLLKRIKTRINVVLFDGEHENIKQYVDNVTGEKNFNVIVVKNDMSHVYAIGEALQNNEFVCLHADRFLEGNKTIDKKFMGGNALFPAGPFTLAAAFNVPVSVVFAFKETALHYHLFGSQPLIRNEMESKKEFAERLSDFFITDLEKKMGAYPLQWFNYYAFWNN